VDVALGDCKAQTVDGYTVFREENLFVDEPGWMVFIKTADYDDHFVYADPAYAELDANGMPKNIGRHKFMCTCGSESVIVGRQAYKQDSSDTDAKIICKYHAVYGVHATGGTKWI